MKKVLKIVFICIIFFAIFNYIFFEMGNNKISNEEIRIDDVLKKYLAYEAEITVIILSNKNENMYKVRQKVEDNYTRLEVLAPKNLEGLVIEKNEKVLKITNKLLNYEKSYENQSYFSNNDLFLNVFVEEYYKNKTTLIRKDNTINLEIDLENNFNTYSKYKELIIDVNSNKPKELIIKDDVQKVKMHIIYNNIDI